MEVAKITPEELEETEQMQMAYLHYIEDYELEDLMRLYLKSQVFVMEALNKYFKWYKELV